MKQLILFFFLIIGFFPSVQAQTTINLAAQCNCEVLKGTTNPTNSPVNPSGANLGDLYLNTNTGDLFYWNGSTWESASVADLDEWENVTNGILARQANANGNPIFIKNDGKVGIGTLYPSDMLSVKGSAHFGTGSTSASGLNALAFGTNSVASGDQSFAGASSTASNGGAFAFGPGAIASGSRSLAIGEGAQSIGSFSHAFGRGITVTAPSSIAVGTYNEDVSNARFMIGNGANGSLRNNILTALTNGRVGIGTVTPNTELHVATNTIIGNNLNTILGNLSLAVGHSNTVNGTGNFAIGGDNTLGTGYYSIAGGNGNTATGNWSVVFGENNSSSRNSNLLTGNNNIANNSDNVLMIGRYAEDISNAYFIIGGGTGGTVTTRKNIMTVLHTGNIGIGTSTPTEKLHVAGKTILTDGWAANRGALLFPNGNGQLWLGPQSGNPADGPVIEFNGSSYNPSNPSAPGSLYLAAGNANGTPDFSVTIEGGTGDVGIGTAVPTEKLTVDGNISLLHGGIIQAQSNASLKIQNKNFNGNLTLESSDLVNINLRNDDDIYRHFTITDDGNGEILRVVGSSGNVGIGTATPSEKLHIFNTSGAQLFLNGYADGDGSHPFNVARGEMILGSNGASIGSKILYNSVDMVFENFRTTATGSGGFRFKTQTSAGTPVEAMYIAIDGDVGIGTTAPNEALQVNGNIKASGNLQSGTNTYPDYVFEAYEKGNATLNKAYHFKNLDEVATFIQLHQHLPGVKGIHDIEKTENGYNVNLTEISIQTLEKVEELFLYTIEQHQQLKEQAQKIEQLEKENAALKARLDKIEALLINKD